MGKAPAFQRYAADYLAEERLTLMTLEEEGAYNRAQAYCWREGSIPADEALLSRLLKGASTNVVRVVQQCFAISPNDDSRLIDPELEAQREKHRLWREKSSEAGKKSGKVRRNKEFHAEPSFNQRSTNIKPTPNSSFSSSSSYSKNKTSKAAPLFVLPDYIDRETWSDFEAMRKTIRKPLTDRARRGIVADLERFRRLGHDPEDILARSITNSWAGVFEPRSTATSHVTPARSEAERRWEQFKAEQTQENSIEAA